MFHISARLKYAFASFSDFFFKNKGGKKIFFFESLIVHILGMAKRIFSKFGM